MLSFGLSNSLVLFIFARRRFLKAYALTWLNSTSRPVSVFLGTSAYLKCNCFETKCDDHSYEVGPIPDPRTILSPVFTISDNTPLILHCCSLPVKNEQIQLTICSGNSNCAGLDIKTTWFTVKSFGEVNMRQWANWLWSNILVTWCVKINWDRVGPLTTEQPLAFLPRYAMRKRGQCRHAVFVCVCLSLQGRPCCSSSSFP